MNTFRKIGFAVTVVVLVLLIALFVCIGAAQAAGDPIEQLTYTPFEDVSIRTKPSLTARVITTATEGTEYTVASYPWTPQTAENSWARIQYRPGRWGWVPVQIGEHIYGQVVFNLGIIWGE